MKCWVWSRQTFEYSAWCPNRSVRPPQLWWPCCRLAIDSCVRLLSGYWTMLLHISTHPTQAHKQTPWHSANVPPKHSSTPPLLQPRCGQHDLFWGFKWTFLTQISHWLRNQQCGSMIMDPGTVPTNFDSIKWTPSRTSYRSWEALKDERTWPAAKWWNGIAVYLICFLLRKSTSTPTAANTQRLQTPIPLASQCMPKVISPLQNPYSKSSLHVLTMITKLREWSCHGRLVFILKKYA